MTKPTLLLDFDGVIHSYTSGWQGADVIRDPPVDGALEFIMDAREHFVVAIYSSRSSEQAGIKAMQRWLERWAGHRCFDIRASDVEWPLQKPAAFLTIDDRCIQFDGTFPKPAELLGFKPWNKQ